MRAVRVGLVGLGRLSEVGYIPALRSLESADLVAVADVVAARCASLAPGLPAFRDAAALVDSGDVELLVVATPPGKHLEAARAATSAGVAALVEKPPAESVDDAVALAALAPRPWLGLNRRFDPAVDRLRRRVSGFDLPVDCSLEMSIDPSRWGSLTAAPGPLLDLGPHLVDLALWVTQLECEAVRADRVGDAVVSFELRLDSGRAVVIASHESAWRESLTFRDAAGSQAGLRRGGRARRVGLRFARGRRSPLVATLAAQLAAACAVLRGCGEDDRLATATHGVVIMRILEAAAASARQNGEWVDPVGPTSWTAGPCSR